jgi:hypothetical protein
METSVLNREKLRLLANEPTPTMIRSISEGDRGGIFGSGQQPLNATVAISEPYWETKLLQTRQYAHIWSHLWLHVGINSPLQRWTLVGDDIFQHNIPDWLVAVVGHGHHKRSRAIQADCDQPGLSRPLGLSILLLLLELSLLDSERFLRGLGLIARGVCLRPSCFG